MTAADANATPGELPASRAREAFATTRWSLVARAGSAGGAASDERGQALGQLCEAYWYPVYAFARRGGASEHDARDLVQEFFTRLLERGGLDGADAARGRFRTYLLAAFRHFQSNERERLGARKRGGGRLAFSLDDELAERRLRDELVDADDPERAYQRSWAQTLLGQVLERLRAEYESTGKGALFERLRPGLQGEEVVGHRAVAEELGSTEGAVRVAAHRLRRRFGDLLEREIVQTLSDPGDAADELRGLFEAAGS